MEPPIEHARADGAAIIRGGMNAELCDGSGQFISFDIDMQVFAAMGSIAGGENEATGL